MAYSVAGLPHTLRVSKMFSGVTTVLHLNLQLQTDSAISLLREAIIEAHTQTVQLDVVWFLAGFMDNAS